ncbi:hypothetical protein BZA05DRAFT_447786 [Tricharina praecox]|uniref:uncharacterized protein n=1 Tax=Tricharina praecox TaxID=43433 RepID=UPI0022208BE9|nr:uncharacterized protein BZA05DRAFT_447786 [Tricharina praecox]KAI5845466.1 hypothetical protein BZA05DRAFT_447786 [Tricharina praecox]
MASKPRIEQASATPVIIALLERTVVPGAIQLSTTSPPFQSQNYTHYYRPTPPKAPRATSTFKRSHPSHPFPLRSVRTSPKATLSTIASLRGITAYLSLRDSSAANRAVCDTVSPRTLATQLQKEVATVRHQGANALWNWLCRLRLRLGTADFACGNAGQSEFYYTVDAELAEALLAVYNQPPNDVGGEDGEDFTLQWKV